MLNQLTLIYPYSIISVYAQNVHRKTQVEEAIMTKEAEE